MVLQQGCQQPMPPIMGLYVVPTGAIQHLPGPDFPRLGLAVRQGIRSLGVDSIQRRQEGLARPLALQKHLASANVQQTRLRGIELGHWIDENIEQAAVPPTGLADHGSILIAKGYDVVVALGCGVAASAGAVEDNDVAAVFPLQPIHKRRQDGICEPAQIFISPLAILSIKVLVIFT
ncbi:MAG: hypothetical protein JWM33_3071 [Caulobacteraceae bacterium]|nr:hypothetical protein [Caulobacteraceae bacterium]